MAYVFSSHFCTHRKLSHHKVIEDCGGMPDLEDKEGEVRSGIPISENLFLINLKFHQTALHKAALNGHLSVIIYLVQKGAEVNARDADGWTPLHNASSKVCPVIFVLILTYNFTIGLP